MQFFYCKVKSESNQEKKLQTLYITTIWVVQNDHSLKRGKSAWFMTSIEFYFSFTKLYIPTCSKTFWQSSETPTRPRNSPRDVRQDLKGLKYSITSRKTCGAFGDKAQPDTTRNRRTKNGIAEACSSLVCTSTSLSTVQQNYFLEHPSCHTKARIAGDH